MKKKYIKPVIVKYDLEFEFCTGYIAESMPLAPDEVLVKQNLSDDMAFEDDCYDDFNQVDDSWNSLF